MSVSYKKISRLFIVVINFLVFLKRVPKGFQWKDGAQQLSFFVKGFCFDKYHLYNFKENLFSTYLSDYFRYCKQARLSKNPCVHFVSNKALFSYVINSIGFTTPKLRGVFRFGGMHWYDQEERGELISKPASGSGGEGVQRFKNINDVRLSEGDLIFDCVEGSGYSNKIYPRSLNTMRILAYKDEKGWFFPFSVHRFGTITSGSADNWGSGGVSAMINPENGVMGELACREKNRVVWRTTHPDTMCEVSGTTIPNWPQVLRDVEAASEALGGFDFLAWDVALDNYNRTVFIEANHVTDVNLIQVHGGMLENSRVKRFYESKGMI